MAAEQRRASKSSSAREYTVYLTRSPNHVILRHEGPVISSDILNDAGEGEGASESPE